MLQFIKQGKISTVIDGLTRSLIRNLPPHNRCAELNTVFQFVRDKIRYTPDIQGVERVATAEQTLESGTGDCDDKVVLLNSMLENIGFKTRVHAIGFRQIGDYTHVVSDVRVYSNSTFEKPRNGWLTLDPCVATAFPGWRPPGVVTHMVRHG